MEAGNTNGAAPFRATPTPTPTPTAAASGAVSGAVSVASTVATAGSSSSALGRETATNFVEKSPHGHYVKARGAVAA